MLLAWVAGVVVAAGQQDVTLRCVARLGQNNYIDTTLSLKYGSPRWHPFTLLSPKRKVDNSLPLEQLSMLSSRLSGASEPSAVRVWLD